MSTTIHDRIRLARRHVRVSQTELANAVGVQRSAVAQWERANGVRPTMENLIKVAVIASMQLEWLATGRGKMALPSSEHSGDQITDLQLSEFALNDEEQRILRAFRSLDRGSVQAIVVLAESLITAKKTRTSAKRNHEGAVAAASA